MVSVVEGESEAAGRAFCLMYLENLQSYYLVSPRCLSPNGLNHKCYFRIVGNTSSLAIELVTFQTVSRNTVEHWTLAHKHYLEKEMKHVFN